MNAVDLHVTARQALDTAALSRNKSLAHPIDPHLHHSSIYRGLI